MPPSYDAGGSRSSLYYARLSKVWAHFMVAAPTSSFGPAEATDTVSDRLPASTNRTTEVHVRDRMLLPPRAATGLRWLSPAAIFRQPSILRNMICRSPGACKSRSRGVTRRLGFESAYDKRCFRHAAGLFLWHSPAGRRAAGYVRKAAPGAEGRASWVRVIPG